MYVCNKNCWNTVSEFQPFENSQKICSFWDTCHASHRPLILQMVGWSGILQGHCVVKLGMDEDLLEQVTQRSDWVGWIEKGGANGRERFGAN